MKKVNFTAWDSIFGDIIETPYGVEKQRRMSKDQRVEIPDRFRCENAMFRKLVPLGLIPAPEQIFESDLCLISNHHI